MIKITIGLLAALAIGLALLELRQQNLNLSHDCDVLHNKIEAQQSKLWNQQLQIATMTGPSAVEKIIADQDLKLVPRATTQPVDPSTQIEN
jgi:cell division protein FtsL